MRARQRHSGPIAVDIGEAGVKLLQMDHGAARPTVIGAAWRPLPRGIGEAERLSRAFDTIAELTATPLFRGRSVVTALRPGEFQIKNVRLPHLPREELDGAVKFEAEERFGFADDRGEFRYLSAGDVRQGTELKEELIVFGAAGSKVSDMLQRFEALKLEPEAIDAAPCAMARSFARFLRREEDAGAINVFVDVGRAGASVVVTRGPEVVFVKTIGIGGARFDEAVAERLGMPLDQANEVRLRIMQTGQRRRSGDADLPATAESVVPNSMREQVADAVRPSVEHLAKELQLCQRYFAVTFRGPRADSITIVGGEAHEPALLSCLAPMVDVPCLVGDPLRGIEFTHEGRLPGTWTHRPGWAVAAGLAMRGSKCVRPLQPKYAAATASAAG